MVVDLPFGSLLLAAIVIVTRPTWHVARHGVTAVHEGGHAAVALLSGRDVRGVRLGRDAGGTTTHRGRRTGAGAVLTAGAGYVAPSALGLAGAGLLAGERPSIVLLAAVGLAVALLPLVRNLFGVVVVLVAGSAVAAVVRWAPEPFQRWAAWALVWALLLGGVRAVWDLHRVRRGRRGTPTDADALRRLTSVPAGVWELVFAAQAVAALAGAARLLLT